MITENVEVLFEAFLKYYERRTKKITQPKKEDRFADFLNDAGKEHSEILIQLYKSKNAKFVAFGLLAMFDLGLLKNNPASAIETNQSALERALKNDLEFRSTRQALRLSTYSNNYFYKPEIKMHLQFIQDGINAENKRQLRRLQLEKD